MIWRYGIILPLAWLLTACDGGEPPAPSEPALPPPVVVEEPAVVGDAETGKTLADAACAKCHGMDGVLAHSGAPFIAGLEQDYLIRSLLAYADGSRKHDKMKAIVDKLGPEKLADVSAYYAQLETPWRGAVRSVKSKRTLQDKKVIAAGKKLAARCNSCHGAEGNAARSDVVPRLAGMSTEYFIPALESYFSGKRQHGIMKLFKKSTSPQDINNLAAYYATRKPKMAPPSRHHRADPAAGKAAATHCAGCHGYDGNSLNPYMPNLAGQPMEYLIKAIKDYRDGRRKEALMQEPVEHLSNKTIADIAAYYSHQRPETPLSEDPTGSGTFDPLSDGAKIAASCNGCHGDRGNSQKPGVPSLTGLHEKYLVAALKAYQQGTRPHDLMRKLVSHFSDTDMEKVSFYYAMQEPAKRDMASTDGDAVAGHKLSESCAMCHGEGGVSTDPFIPSLAGQDARYLTHATQAYASGARKSDKMQAPAEALSESDIRDLVAYYSSQPPQRSDTWPPESPEFLIKQRCDRCHGERGFSTSPGKPRLAGQSEAYLVVAMQEYQDGTRTSQTMHAMADVLSLLEIKAVAAYYARQTADGEENGTP